MDMSNQRDAGIEQRVLGSHLHILKIGGKDHRNKGAPGKYLGKEVVQIISLCTLTKLLIHFTDYDPKA